MADESSVRISVKVRDLITAYESKTTGYSRPRARSLGNVLAKNVVVREHQINTLEDIEEALKHFETELNQYEVYKKEQHVALQNVIFNILTSIASVKNDEKENEKKRYFILNTQRFVSLLNNKLPSHNPTVTEQHKYITYEEYKLDRKENRAVGYRMQATTPVAESEEGKFNVISNLRDRFQPRVVDDATWGYKEGVKDKRIYRSDFSLSLTRSDTVDSSTQEASLEPVEEQEAEAVEGSKRASSSEGKLNTTSVSKLKNLFENKTGLNVILKNDAKRFRFRVNIPYNARREPVRTFQNSPSLRSFVEKTVKEEAAVQDDEEVEFQQATVVEQNGVGISSTRHSGIVLQSSQISDDLLGNGKNEKSGSESDLSDSDSIESVRSIKAIVKSQ